MDTLHVVLLVGIATLTANGDILEAPVNKAHVKGDNPTFTCKVSNPGFEQWSNQLIGQTTFDQLTVNGMIRPGANYEDLYELHKQNDYFNLEVLRQELAYAGVYRCEFLGATSVNRYAQFTMLESEPVCTTNITGPMYEGEISSSTCSVMYRGNMAPKMDWSSATEKMEDVIDESMPGNYTKVTIVAEVSRRLDSTQYTCLTFFDAPTVPPNNTEWATNAPAWTGDYSTPAMIVHWPADNAYISPEKPQYYPGDILTCAGDANPPVNNFKWESIIANTTELIKEGADAKELEIPEDWVGQDMKIRCSLTNQMRDGDHTEEVTIDLTVVAGAPLATGAIVGIVFAGIAVIVIILLIVYFVVVKGRTSKEEEANHTMPSKPVPHDQVRTMKNEPTPGPYDHNPPPYDQDPYSRHPYDNRNAEGLVYADLALDDTPRSRKPIQFGTEPDSTLYADVRPGPMV